MKIIVIVIVILLLILSGFSVINYFKSNNLDDMIYIKEINKTNEKVITITGLTVQYDETNT